MGDTPGHAATPVRKSAASRPAPAAFQPLADARPGEWAEYRTLEHGRLRYEVVEVGAARVRTRVHLTKGGQPLGEPAIREDRPEYDPVLHRDAYHQPEITCESQKLDLAGRSWDARRCESRWVDEEIHYLRKTWLSAEAPVYGLLRMDLYGDERLEASLELSAFGGADP